MPWSTPTLKQTRILVRDEVTSALSGAILIGNNVLRVMSDVQAGLCHLVLRFIEWLSRQLMADTAETEWLDRHADIWLVNADGTTGRKMASLAEGIATFTGFLGTVIPAGARLLASDNIEYELLEDVALSIAASPGPIRALDPGVVGNRDAESPLTLSTPISGVDSEALVVELSGGVDEESDRDLRIRVLERIRQPPMGGDLTDYIAWAKAVSGVTRAWCAPLEQGIGTVTVRFMMDQLRADLGGFPTGADIQAFQTYLNTVRPVAVKEVYVVAPIPQRVDVFIEDLVPDTTAVRAAIENSLQAMLLYFAKPGQPIYAAWKFHAIQDTPGVDHFTLEFKQDDLMPSPGHLPVLGDIVYGTSVTTP
jgi:uncharacterized phage protein gp47/JayE